MAQEMDAGLDESELDRILDRELEELGSVGSIDTDEELDNVGHEDYTQGGLDEERLRDSLLDDAWASLTSNVNDREKAILDFENDYSQLLQLASVTDRDQAQVEKSGTIGEIEGVNTLLKKKEEEEEEEEEVMNGESAPITPLTVENTKAIEFDMLKQVSLVLNELVEKLEEQDALAQVLEYDEKEHIKESAAVANDKELREEGHPIKALIVETKECPKEEKEEEEEENANSFLSALASELEEREQERVQAMRMLEEERERAVALEVQKWLQHDAAVAIQAVVRCLLSRKQRKVRKSAVDRIQNAMKAVSNRIRGFKLRKKLKRQAQVERNIKAMEAEDLLARHVRRRQKEEQARMAAEVALMDAENVAGLRLRAAEHERASNEQRQMRREDQLALDIRRAEALRRERLQSLSRTLNSAVVFEHGARGPAVILESNGYSDFSPATYSSSQALPYELWAVRNAFERFEHLLPHACLGAKLERVQVQANSIRNLEGVERCINLTVLNLANNQLCLPNLAPLRLLPCLRVLDLSSNPLDGVFRGGNGALAGKASGLHELYLSNCGLTALPIELYAPELHTLVLSKNKIVGDTFCDQSNSLPELKTLDLSSNQLGPALGGRCAHAMPSLETLDISNNKIDNVVLGLLEHINLCVVNVAPYKFGDGGDAKEEAKQISRHLKHLASMDGDSNYLYSPFREEIIQLQSAVRGALTRERVRVAFEKARFSATELGDEEFEQVDLDEFMGQVSDDDADPIEFDAGSPESPEQAQKSSIASSSSSSSQKNDAQSTLPQIIGGEETEYMLAVARLQEITKKAYADSTNNNNQDSSNHSPNGMIKLAISQTSSIRETPSIDTTMTESSTFQCQTLDSYREEVGMQSQELDECRSEPHYRTQAPSGHEKKGTRSSAKQQRPKPLRPSGNRKGGTFGPLMDRQIYAVKKAKKSKRRMPAWAMKPPSAQGKN